MSYISYIYLRQRKRYILFNVCLLKCSIQDILKIIQVPSRFLTFQIFFFFFSFQNLTFIYTW